MSRQPRNNTLLSEDASELVKAASASSAGDGLKIAAALIALQARVYNAISQQGSTLLLWALAAALLGVAFLGAAPLVLVPRGNADTARLILICGGMIEGLAALLLVLFGINLLRLAACQHQLSHLERFMLANNLCHALPEPARSQAYAELAGRLSGGPAVGAVLGEVTGALDRMVVRSRRAAPAQPGAADGQTGDTASSGTPARE